MIHTSRHAFRILSLTPVALALPGCAFFSHREPAPLAAPPATIAQTEFAGTALSGPAAHSIDPAAAAQAWRVSARIFAAEALPDSAALSPIGPLARLVIGHDPSVLFSPSSRLAYSTRAGPLEQGTPIEPLLGAPGRWKELQKFDGAVAPGSAILFEIALKPDAEASANLSRRKLSLALDRQPATDGYELALISEDLLLPDLRSGQEKIVVSRNLSDGRDRMVFSAPMRFPDSPATGLVIDLTVDAKDVSTETIAAMQQQIEMASSTATARMKLLPTSPADAGIAAALEGIVSLPPQRGTLEYLASQTGANLTAAVVLVADEKAMDIIVGEIRSRVPNLRSRDATTIGWMLDRATIRAVSSIKQEDAPTTLPPIMGALSVYAGIAGRELDVLQSLARQSASSDDLYARITAEQYIALEDGDPAIRVGAYDWLGQRHLAPAGYDPLGSPRERGAALNKFAEATTQPATPASGK